MEANWNWNQSLEPGRNIMKLQSFWRHLKEELNFRTWIYYKRDSCNCSSEEFLKDNNAAVLIRDQTIYPPYLKARQDTDILALSCLRISDYENTLRSLSTMLNHMRFVPIWLDICDDNRQIKESLTKLAGTILKRCWELQMVNVILTASDFPITEQIYAYQPFPTFNLLSLTYHETLRLFPYKLNNLYGYNIRTLPDESEPLSIVYRNANGELMIGGMVWRMMMEFARHLNATLKLAMEPQGIIPYARMLQYVQNNTIDISASLRPLIRTPGGDFQEYSFPVYVGSWCTMLPVERILSSYEAMETVMQSPWSYLYILIIYMLYRWLAGQGLNRLSLFRLILPLSYLFLLSSLLAQLSALLIRPQQKNLIENLDQLNGAGIRIMGLRSESIYYPTEMKIKYASSLMLEDHFNSFMEHRSSFNTSYGYTVTSIKWAMYKEQQNYFKKPLFRYSENICVQKMSLFGLLLHYNCPYRDQLTGFIFRLHESGLLKFWNRWSLYDMIQANHLHLIDLSRPFLVQSIRWEDWVHVAILYGFGLTVALIIFLLELTVNYINVFLDSL